MNQAVQALSQELAYLDHFSDYRKLLIWVGLLIFTAIPVDIIGQFAIASLII